VSLSAVLYSAQVNEFLDKNQPFILYSLSELNAVLNGITGSYKQLTYRELLSTLCALGCVVSRIQVTGLTRKIHACMKDELERGAMLQIVASTASVAREGSYTSVLYSTAEGQKSCKKM